MGPRRRQYHGWPWRNTKSWACVLHLAEYASAELRTTQGVVLQQPRYPILPVASNRNSLPLEPMSDFPFLQLFLDAAPEPSQVIDGETQAEGRITCEPS